MTDPDSPLYSVRRDVLTDPLAFTPKPETLAKTDPPKKLDSVHHNVFSVSDALLQ